MLETILARVGDLGIPLDLVKAAVMLAAAFPAAIVYRLIPRRAPPTFRHVYSIVMSGTLFCTLFDVTGLAQLGGAAVSVYGIVKAKRAKRWAPIAVFAFALGGLSLNHIVGQLILKSNVSFDHTAPMMVLVIKLTSFAWAAYDGTRNDEDLSEDQRKLAIRKMPGLIEYLGYIFFFGGFLVGPSFEFVDYKRFIENQPPFDKRPSSFVPTIRALGAAAISFVLFFKFGNSWSYMHALTPDFSQQSMFRRLLFMQIAGGIARSKYYVAWKLSEAACVLTGIGFNGYSPSGEPRWDRVQNIAIRKFELANNPKSAIDNWNKNTGLWLRRYVYLRIVDSGIKSTAVAAVATYVASAFWHGFRPGFYLTFVTGSFLNIGARTIRRNIRPLFHGNSKLAPLRPVYDVLGWAATIGAINYLVAPFVVHSVHNSLTVWKANAFMLHIALGAVQIGYGFLGLGALTRKFGESIGATYPPPSHRHTKQTQAEKKKLVSPAGNVDEKTLTMVADIVDSSTNAMSPEATERS
ncbi:MBOAT, membrane-bound O-acyltransferase family-domain-containing protein [Geranomyces variabilis]|nr:MBOAT, membrane-bound O-acyltransferase family-domain-containing protein [Geranomyces variabilis]KAJ3137702.1 lysophospholipid acyltransferase [Geranomyces variabilis]